MSDRFLGWIPLTSLSLGYPGIISIVQKEQPDCKRLGRGYALQMIAMTAVMSSGFPPLCATPGGTKTTEVIRGREAPVSKRKDRRNKTNGPVTGHTYHNIDH